ncbi:hypothetical protein SUGI_0346360 [Cryptomeria japonica]|uniref:putative F-box/LRR-repeat protein At3g42770 n=1 Tax=Cryptomeria japonica TaxID=3369 RepID=UPI002408D201|nr:putative F-box/LRR-repeat protein At3g42770 [Cryptomeria japonica]GLJ19257.1 hypothetical protein SUGI_0346360 [Cryptomeria japonica]
MGKTDLMNFPCDLFCSQILTRLPLKEAVRFSAVSRKWCRAWTRLSHLQFSDDFFISISTTPTKRKAVSKLTRQNIAVDIINKIILMQCGGLEIFELDSCVGFESSIHKWLLWISSSGVKCIDLKNNGLQLEVSESIFSCVTLTSLSLLNFKMIKVPPLFQGFSQLVTCFLEYVELSSATFKAILKLCRLLESLTLSECELPSNLKIISLSLKSLALLGLYIYSIKANCPRLESIKIIECNDLKIGNICLPVCVHLETDFWLLKDFSTIKSLRKIACSEDVDYTSTKTFLIFKLVILNKLKFSQESFIANQQF